MHAYQKAKGQAKKSMPWGLHLPQTAA